MVKIFNESSRLSVSFNLSSDEKHISANLNPQEQKILDTDKSTMILQVIENRPNGDVLWSGYIPTSFENDVQVIINPENKSVCLNEGTDRRPVPPTSTNARKMSSGKSSVLWIILIIIIILCLIFIYSKSIR